MADVFVVSMFLSYFSAIVISEVEARLLAGFYCFLAYCIISLAATQIMCLPPFPNDKPEHETTKTAGTIEQPLVTPGNTDGDDTTVHSFNQMMTPENDVASINQLAQSANR
ncbi:unnamed protein product [Rotaria sp. Silwood1]|nr:unnamed protein product [Rotaria sp. Silwood1]